MTKDVHVKAHTREGDEHVKEHWRSRPGEGHMSHDEKEKIIKETIETFENRNFAKQGPFRRKDFDPNQEIDESFPYKNTIGKDIIDDEFKKQMLEMAKLYPKEKNIFEKAYSSIDREIKKAARDTIAERNPLLKWAEELTRENPENAKMVLRHGANFAPMISENLKDSAEMLSASLNFNKDAYKIGNALVVSNFNDVGHLSDIVKEKLESQNMNLETTPGIVFTPDSGISKAIAQSEEIKQFEKTNRRALQQRALTEKKDLTINLSSTTNLKTAINNADILFAYYDDNGDLVTAILDTYDFNKGETSSLVKMGRNVQEAGMLTNYFDIFFTRTPKGKLYD